MGTLQEYLVLRSGMLAAAAAGQDAEPMMEALAHTQDEELPYLVDYSRRVGQGGFGEVFMRTDGAAGVIKVVGVPIVAPEAGASELAATILKKAGVLSMDTLPKRWAMGPSCEVAWEGKRHPGLRLYLAMDLFDMDLETYLKKYVHVHQPGDNTARRVAMEPLLRALLEVVQQVESLHKRGLIHGDIKGRNILLKVCPYTGIILSAHLTDWGSLAHLGGDTTELSTRIGTNVPRRDPNGGGLACKRSDMYNIGRLILEALFGPHLLDSLKGDLVPPLAQLWWIEQLTHEAVRQAAQEQSGATTQPDLTLASELLEAAVVLGSEVGLGYHDPHSWLAAHRMSSLTAPGAQPSRVVKALGVLLPLVLRLMTLDESGTDAGDVVLVLEEVVAGLQMPYTHKVLGLGLLTLTAPLWPTCRHQLAELANEVIPHGMATVTPAYVGRKVQEKWDAYYQSLEEEQLQEVGAEEEQAGLEGAIQQQQQQQEVEAEEQGSGVVTEEQQQQQAQHSLTAEQVKLLAEAGWVIEGSQVVGPAGQSVLITGPLVHQVLLLGLS